ncbi:SDR family oxidoreductase [Shimia thalassica]|jgi:3-oxoacyl-[acyl-carrier protein] reductase|uniref:3-oxoacyl-[acyl-carrier-protein] reductase FabG n=1 Tax=Shimia thalassica TaxID=1715693 RepID=A0A0P1I1H3_9RHOB|nr:SDR family NAD(P)-dependent oxidoreductase [Shimia thalassica]MBU2942881.1 SDR family oxidoreductase [Shimia thalassica]MDO6480042.1 SDR family oxidoreductase [Shimia thalassica]MDO6484107.1 SDR family oxidoreductase [Shimia thalassica]MDO6502351.1 SDR family oxidoreductase [Shimia thalassica]MDO6520821.1 SDR family oxidoreductase [Shimia thalassica]
MGKLDGKTAYITGAGNGIGRAVALKLASEGANIVVNDLDADPAIDVVNEIKAAGGNAAAVPGSVTEDGFAERFIGTGIETFGGVDIIVNNAGYTWDSMIGYMTDQQFDAMMDVHVKAPFRILRAASGFIKGAAKQEAEEGREVFRKVVNISSIAGTGGNVGQVNYSSAKSAMLGMTKTLAKEWGRLKVNVNCIAFGYIETRLTEATDEKKTITVDGNEVGIGIPKKVAGGFASMVPLGRPGTPEEAADGVYLFCCPESNYVSGQTLIVGGGLTA